MARTRPWPPPAHPDTVQEVLDAIAHTHDHILKTVGDGFAALRTEIRHMSGTLTEQLDAATAAIRADVAAVAAEVATLLAGMNTGDQITQQQVDALTAIDASLKAIPPAPAAP